MCLSFLPERSVVERWVSWADVTTTAGLLVASRPRRSGSGDGSRVRGPPGRGRWRRVVRGEAAEGARKRTVTIMYELASCVPQGCEGGVCMIYYYYYNIIVYRKSTIRVKWRFLLPIFFFFLHFLCLHGLCASSWYYRWAVGRKRVLNWGKKWKILLVYARVYKIHESRTG